MKSPTTLSFGLWSILQGVFVTLWFLCLWRYTGFLLGKADRTIFLSLFTACLFLVSGLIFFLKMPFLNWQKKNFHARVLLFFYGLLISILYPALGILIKLSNPNSIFLNGLTDVLVATFLLGLPLLFYVLVGLTEYFHSFYSVSRSKVFGVCFFTGVFIASFLFEQLVLPRMGLPLTLLVAGFLNLISLALLKNLPPSFEPIYSVKKLKQTFQNQIFYLKLSQWLAFVLGCATLFCLFFFYRVFRIESQDSGLFAYRFFGSLGLALVFAFVFKPSFFQGPVKSFAAFTAALFFLVFSWGFFPSALLFFKKYLIASDGSYLIYSAASLFLLTIPLAVFSFFLIQVFYSLPSISDVKTNSSFHLRIATAFVLGFVFCFWGVYQCLNQGAKYDTLWLVLKGLLAYTWFLFLFLKNKTGVWPMQIALWAMMFFIPLKWDAPTLQKVFKMETAELSLVGEGFLEPWFIPSEKIEEPKRSLFRLSDRDQEKESSSILGAHLAALLSSKLASVAFFGVGNFVTPSIFLEYPQVKKIQLIDFPQKLSLFRKNIDASRFQYVENEKVTWKPFDPSRYFRQASEKYHLIFLSQGQPWKGLEENGFYLESLKQLEKHLEEEGALAIEIQTQDIPVDFLWSFLKNVQWVFPKTYTFRTAANTLLVFAQKIPISFERIQQAKQKLLSSEPFVDSLEELGIKKIETLLAMEWIPASYFSQKFTPTGFLRFETPEFIRELDKKNFRDKPLRLERAGESSKDYYASLRHSLLNLGRDPGLENTELTYPEAEEIKEVYCDQTQTYHYNLCKEIVAFFRLKGWAMQGFQAELVQDASKEELLQLSLLRFNAQWSQQEMQLKSEWYKKYASPVFSFEKKTILGDMDHCLASVSTKKSAFGWCLLQKYEWLSHFGKNTGDYLEAEEIKKKFIEWSNLKDKYDSDALAFNIARENLLNLKNQE